MYLKATWDDVNCSNLTVAIITVFVKLILDLVVTQKTGVLERLDPPPACCCPHPFPSLPDFVANNDIRDIPAKVIIHVLLTEIVKISIQNKFSITDVLIQSTVSALSYPCNTFPISCDG